MERFFSKTKLADGPRIGMGIPCLEWTAYKDRDGYGKFFLNGKVEKANRVAWKLEHGPIPDDLCVLHKCDNPPCVKIEHLFLGTNSNNVADRQAKGREARGEAHGQAKLTEGDVLFIRELRGMGWTVERLAAEFGVCHAQVSRIFAGAVWTHIKRDGRA